MPLELGPVKFVPYLKGQLTEYTSDLNGDNAGRAWGGGGARASIPFTRLYPDVQSELFNLSGINHKITLGGNYFLARTNEHFDRFAQLDRLNDEATDEAMRDIRPRQPLIYPGTVGQALATSLYYDPQTYAIRRLIDNRIDTVDDIQVLQVDLRQRLQTKRGFPGSEHIVDWMVLNTSFSYFPEQSQNFNKSFSFVEYQYLWNIGDRTSIESTGWYDPQDLGVRVFTVGMSFARTDRTSFYLGYRQTDPLESRMLTAAVTYVFSPKYAMTASASYDLGTSAALSNSLLVSRTGTDLTVSLGFTYNSLQNNFGAIVEVVPNLVPANKRYGAQSLGGQGGLLGR